MHGFRFAFLSLSKLRRRQNGESDIDAELRFHIEMRMQDNIDDGMTPEQARDDAMRRFGDFNQVKERCVSIKESGSMKFLRSFLWMAIACWLAFAAINPKNFGLTDVLFEASAICILCCLLMRARSRQRSKSTAEAVGESFALVGEHAGYQSLKSRSLWNSEGAADVSSHDKGTHTPVERLLRDE